MNDPDDVRFGQHPFRFSFGYELGCGLSVIGFVVFVIVVLVVWEYAFN